MERLSIDELLDAYDKIMRVTSSGTPLYQRAESVRYYLQQLRHYQKLGAPFDHLRDIIQAEQDGRLVVLPCKVGDTVYVINRHLNRVFECTVISISVGQSTDLKNYIKTKWVGPNGNESIRKWSLRQIGKYVFMNREDAEAALAGKGGDGE